MKKCYLFLMMLFVQLITCGSVYAADPPKAEYDAALAAITGPSYYIYTEVDGVKFYLTQDGELTDFEESRHLYGVSQVSGGALYDIGWMLDPGNGAHYSNSTLENDKCVLHPQTGVFRQDNSNNRNDWERQVLYMNEEGKFAIRSCNTAFGESSWADAGRAFWTYEVEDVDGVISPIYSEYGGLMPAYSYEPAYIWSFELPATKEQVYLVLNGIYSKYEDQVWDDLKDPYTMNMGTGFGQLADYDTWEKFWTLLQEINAICDKLLKDGYVYEDDPDAPTLEQAKSYSEQADSLYQVLLDSEVPYMIPQDGYYRIIAHNRYKSTFDESGFVDKAIAASFSQNHENKAVHATLRRDRANFLWKLTQQGDSVMIQNAGLGTYISISQSDGGDNKVYMTDDVNDASGLMLDYAYSYDDISGRFERGPQYVEPDGNGAEKDIICLRLASSPRRDGRYVHQMDHSSVGDDSSPWGNYGTDTGEEKELGFWMRTWDYLDDNGNRRTTDLNTSEWFLEFVPEDEAAAIIEDFEAIFNHDKLVEQNNELRDKVAETLALAKDIIRTKMITSADQMDNRFGDSSEGQNIGNLIDNDASTFWHTTWHGLAEGVEPFYYYGEGYEEGLECHYLQISGMENMVGDCELYLRERDGADNDRVKTLVIMGTDNLKNEDDEWDEIARITLPHTDKGEENTVPFTVAEAYPYIRVFAIETAYSSYAFRQFWHAAELQFYTVKENPNSQFNQMGQVAQDLQDTYDANCATPDEEITLQMYEALKAAYEAFLSSGLVDPAELRAALETYAKATEGVVEGKNPGQWSDKTIADQYNALYAEVEDYNTAGKYNAAEIHKYAVMLKAMKKSVMEKANVVETDKWYRIMYPTEEMFDAYGFNKDGGDNCNELTPEDQRTMWGTFVAPGKLESDQQTDYDEEGNEVTTTINWLESIGGEDLRESDRLFFVNDEAINDKDASMFRFVELESEDNDYIPLFQDAKENMIMALDMSTTYTRGEALITNVSQLSSNASDEAEGKDLGALIDGKSDTFWHSDWHVKVIAPPYLQVAFDEPVSGLVQVEITRRNNGFGHIVRMYIVGSNDAENWTNIGYLEAPYGGSPSEVVSCLPIDLGSSYKYLRFINTCRWLNGGGNSTEMDPFAEPKSADEYDKTWTYFHAAEFQIYPVTADKALSASGKALQAAYATANKVIFKDVTAEDLAAAANGYKAFKDEFNGAQGKAVLPNGLDKAPATYALQNKATGLFVFVDGTGNQNNIYLKTIPTLVNYKAIGYERSLLGGKNLAGESTNYLHAGESNRRFCTWSTTEPTTNSGLFICEADEAYAAPAEFSFFKNVKPGRIIDWCHSVSLTPVEAPDDAYAYTAVGQYTLGEDETAETFLALKEIETIPAGEPVLYILGDTTSYDANDDYVEPIKFTISGNEKPVVEGATVNGLIGTLVTYALDGTLIYFNANYAAVPAEGQNLAVTPCSAVLDLDNCPQVDPNGSYDFSICLGSLAADVADGVKDISTAIENISKPGNVYSMDGKLLRTGATLNSLKSLGKGMYILNGVKVVVK